MYYPIGSSFTCCNILRNLLTCNNSLTIFDAIFLILKYCRILITWESLTLQDHVNFLLKLINLTQALQSLVILVVAILVFILALIKIDYILHNFISRVLVRCYLSTNCGCHSRKVLVSLIDIFLLLL
jgi:hypothetical protein